MKNSISRITTLENKAIYMLRDICKKTFILQKIFFRYTRCSFIETIELGD